MTTYTPILDAEIDAESPVTDLLLTRLRDNPLAIGEAAAGVPASARPTVLLGTLTTTSGSSQTLSGLDLTPYKFLRLVWDGVSASGGSNFEVDFKIVVVAAENYEQQRGMMDIDLFDGTFTSNSSPSYSGPGESRAGGTSITTASTSVRVDTTAGSFDAGSIRFYGMK